MLTPAKIQAISDPIEEVYIHIVDELLVNIGKHLTSPTWTHTAAWEIQKLSEMGQLTQENAEIINKWIKQLPQEVRDAMEETRRLALEKIEKDMEKAVRLGKLPEPLADSTVNVLNEYSQQAIDQLNLVNTVMLQSSVQQYQRGVQLTKEEYDKLMQQQEQTQIILNEAAGSVATGIETREKALRRAITRISDEGLTGFIDRAGHHWTPEAYVNMDIRTTVHNTAIQSVKNFMTDYNTQVFQVSSHAAARPGCYPYQGKFYSWDNSAGEIELGNGNRVRYEPLNVTTYGQPAGLFGINCGHYPIPIVPGVTIPHGADNIQPKEENDKAYAESQVQRSLERQIREAKRVVEMAGDKASPEMKQRVKDAQEQMRDFIAKTGRTRRYDREKIGGLPKGSGTQTAGSGKVNTQLTKPQPDRNILNGIKGLSDDFKHGMADVLNACGNQDAINLYSKYANELQCTNPAYKKGAYFSNRDGGVSMNVASVNKANSYETAYEVPFHEFGHMIDWLGNGKDGWTYLSNSPKDGRRLQTVIKSDFQEFKKSLGVGRMAEVIPILKKERDALPDDKRLIVYGNISDIIEGCTGISYPLGCGHGAKYHKRDGATEREFFAEVLDSAVANQESYEQMKRVFPNAVDMVWDMVRGIL